MADRPIPFSAPMVHALLDGSKTQTRRVLTPQPNWLPEVRSTRNGNGPFFWPVGALGQQCGRPVLAKEARYVIGDRLWVREAFSYDTLDVDRDGTLRPWYWADGNIADADQGSGNFTKPKPSIHMPRWASRLTLTVTDVRVERLQDISEADAIAEGALVPWTGFDRDSDTRTGRSEFEALWNHINGPGAWEANPWVVAVSFDVERRNIDAGGAA